MFSQNRYQKGVRKGDTGRIYPDIPPRHIRRSLREKSNMTDRGEIAFFISYLSDRVTMLFEGSVTVSLPLLTLYSLLENGLRLTFSGCPKSL